MDLTDFPPPPATSRVPSPIAVLRRYAAAHRALWSIDIRDYEAGLLEETPEFAAANSEACDAHDALPRWLEPAAMIIDRRIIRDLDYFARTGQ